jgi:hypothetical protein
MKIPRARFRFGIPLLFCVASLAALASVGTARAGEAYYVVLFASQRVPNDPEYSHTFATFVRTSWPGNGRCTRPVSVEAHTISWLPSNLKIRVLALMPESGHNYTLDQTLRYALANDARVSLWGPYQIEPELYVRALRRKQQLESGNVCFKADDALYDSDCVTNCIHAVGGTVDGMRVRVLIPGWGEVASYAVLLRMEPWIIDPNCVHPWVGSALGLDRYPIIYRAWRPPLSGAVLGPINRLLGGERCLTATYGPPAYR